MLSYNVYKNNEVIFVTNDINLRIRADIYGVKAEEYKHNRVNRNDLYSGMRQIEVTQDVVDQLYNSKVINWDHDETLEHVIPYANECFIFKSGKQSVLCRFNVKKGVYKIIHQDLKTCAYLTKKC